jgi:hypothetical protein
MSEFYFTPSKYSEVECIRCGDTTMHGDLEANEWVETDEGWVCHNCHYWGADAPSDE